MRGGGDGLHAHRQERPLRGRTSREITKSTIFIFCGKTSHQVHDLHLLRQDQPGDLTDALELFKKTLPGGFVQIQLAADSMRAHAPLVVQQAQRPLKVTGLQLDSTALTLRDKKAGFKKVIKMIHEMVDNLKAEQVADNDEQVQFAAYKQFCDDTTVETTRTISEANEKIDKLQSDIQKYEEDAARLGIEIEGHDDDISAWQGDAKASSSVRTIEHQDYVETHKDYSESIVALKDGIKTLKAQNHDVGQSATALAQLSSSTKFSSLVPAETKAAIDKFLNQGQADLELLEQATAQRQQQP